MATLPRQWPAHAEAKRQEAMELADENNQMLREARTASSERTATIMAEVRANNERIARLMETAKK